MLGLGVNMGSTTPRWTPRRLFLDGSAGAWFDPSDLSTVFQDAAGTIPGAVGSPVGLLLDKSQGLARVNLNPPATSSPTGWGTYLCNISSDGTSITATSTSTNEGYVNCLQGLIIAGKTYEVSFQVVSRTQAFGTLQVGQTLQSVDGLGVKSYIIRATNTHGIWIGIGVGPIGSQVTFKNISIRELPGNHASQSTSSAKPILRQDAGGRYYLEFDGVDDRLDVAAPHLFSPMTASTAFRGTNANSHFVWCTYDGATYGANLYSTNGAALQIYPSYTVGTRTGLEQVATYISKPNVDSWNNGIQVANNLASAGIADNNGALGIGGRPTGSFFFAGRIYGLLIAKKALTDPDRQKLERYMARKSGVAL